MFSSITSNRRTTFELYLLCVLFFSLLIFVAVFSFVLDKSHPGMAFVLYGLLAMVFVIAADTNDRIGKEKALLAPHEEHTENASVHREVKD